MDQLKPIIKHHYWICFGLAVIFITVGWSLAIGKLAEATKARRDKVEAAFSTAGQGGDKPNKNWIASAKKVNEADREAYNESSRALWQRQKDARVWHNALQEEMKNVPFNDTITLASTRRKWGANYGEQFDELLDIIQPFNIKDGTGLVVVDKRRITHKNYDSWKYKAPTSEEIWKNQEDIWLLKSLLTSLARVNEGAGRITEASLREIVALRLRGGDREYKPSSGGAGMGGFGGMGMGMGGMGMGGGDAGEMSDAMGGMGMGMGMNSGGARAQSTGPWKAFEGSVNMDLLGEEFGPVGGGAMMGAMGDDGGGAAGAMAEGAMNNFGSMGMGGFGGGGFGAAAATETKRYVDEGENGEGYKTRAFFLHVKVKEDQIPRLLAELTDSDFPVEIVRVDLKTFGGRSTSAGGMGGMYSGGGAGDPAMAMGGVGGMDMGMGMGGDPYAGGIGGDAMGAMDDLGGAMMTPGMGMGIGADPAMGDGGYGPPGVGREYGDMPYGSGGYGDGGYGSGGYGMPGMGQEQQTGRQALAAAMSDPMLVDLRVAGLMTLYQSQEETVAEEATEAAAAQEAVSDPGTPVPPEGSTEGTPDSAAPASETPVLDPAAAVPGAPADEAPAADPSNSENPAANPPAGAAPAAEGSETGAAAPDTVDPDAGSDPASTTSPADEGSVNPPNG